MANKIYLDAGHGGKDPGAVKYITEKDATLVMALACKEYLEASGITVKMSRTADTDTKINTMATEANNWGADYIVSMHCNAGGGKGFEAYHTLSGGKGKVLAQAIETEVKAIGQTSRGLKIKANSSGLDYFGIIRLTNAPAIICEAAFVDNETDVKMIEDATKQKAFGVAYAKGILKTLGVADKSEAQTSTTTSTSATTSTATTSKVVAEDGEWGKSTTTYTQKLFGTTQDGIVSGQRTSCKKYLPNALTSSWEFKLLGSGSAVMKKLQSHVGATSDGLAGKGTVTAMQSFLKTKGFYTGSIDGVMGKQTVIGWQKYLNSQF